MAIVDKIHDLTKKMTGQDGVGSDITTAINDLTAKWTQSAGKGSNIEESIANLSSNASSGGGGATIPTVTITNDNTYTCDIGYDGWHSLIENSIYAELESKVYPSWVLSPPPPGVPGGLAGAFFSSYLDDNGIYVAIDQGTRFIFHDDGTWGVHK